MPGGVSYTKQRSISPNLDGGMEQEYLPDLGDIR